MTEAKPYWTMSRLDIKNFGRYDWLYKHPAPQPKIKPRTSLAKPQKTKKSALPKSFQDMDPADEIELVGYKPTEYKSIPCRPPLRGCTAPTQSGRKDIFNDMHTPIQVTKRFNGSPIISVPIASVTRRNNNSHNISKTRKPNDDESAPIHDILFEESIDLHEDIDPWGFSRDEKVVAPDKSFHGIKLTVSRLNQPKK